MSNRYLAAFAKLWFTVVMEWIHSLESLDTLLPIILVGGAVQSIISLQFLMFGLGARGMFFGFCAILLGLYISVVRFEVATGASVATARGPYQEQLEKRIERTALTQQLEKKLEGHEPRAAILVMVSDLTRGMTAGLLLLIPFLIIDLVVLHVFRLLVFQGLSVSIVSLPLKVVLFLSVDGWTVLTQRLLG